MKVNNHQSAWTSEQEAALMQMAEMGYSSAQIAEALQRTRASVCTRKAMLQSSKRLSRSTPEAEAPRTLRKNTRREEAPRQQPHPQPHPQPRVPDSSLGEWKELLAYASAQAKDLGIRVHITVITFEP